MIEGLANQALRLGCPVLAAEIVLAPETVVDRHLRRRLAQRRVRWKAPLPAAAPQRERLERLLAEPVPVLQEPDGAYALAAHPWPGGVVGSVRVLHAEPGRFERLDDFDRGCHDGELAAIAWLHARAPVLLPPGPERSFAVRPIPPLRVAGGSEQRAGHSAGLAAAIASAWAFFDGPRGLRVAATGRVSPSGAVFGVDHVEAKLRALVREAPHVQLVFVPAANVADVPGDVTRVLDVRYVATVSDALDALFSDASWPALEELDCERAADLAVEHESHKRPAAAVALARRVLDRVDAGDVAEVDRPRIAARARAVIAINLCHIGSAKDALAELERLDREIAGARDELGCTAEAMVEIRRAAAYIDVLRPADALGALARIDARALDGQQARIELYGTLARARLLAGDVDGALDASGRQRQYGGPGVHRHQRNQINCNYLAIVLEQHRRAVRAGHGEAAWRLRAEMRAVIAETRAVNAELPDGLARKSNDAFLDLWETRYAAALGDSDLALARAGPVPDASAPAPARQFPALYKQRFAGEALWRAGRTAEALDRLDRAARVAEPRGDFERLILQTIAARAACIRKHAGAAEEDWEPPIRDFLAELAAWAPSYEATLAIDDGSEIEAILDRLPY